MKKIFLLLLELVILIMIVKPQVPLVYGSKNTDFAVQAFTYINSDYLNYSKPRAKQINFTNTFPSTFRTPAIP